MAGRKTGGSGRSGGGEAVGLLLDGYVRVSTVRDRGGESFISPEVQRAQIEGWIGLNGMRVGRVFEELNESGGRADRPKLLEAIERVERGESDGIVVAKLDRFGRSLIDGLAKIERISQAGGLFASVQDGLDLSTPTGKLVLRIMLSMAEWELDRIRDNWLVAVRRAVDRGIHPGPHTPLGYLRAPGGRLEPDPIAAPLIARIYGQRAAGASAATCADTLNDSGLLTARGSARFTGSIVARLLKNRVYLGEARSGGHMNREAHPPLVDLATWQRAQAPNRKWTAASAGLLTGFLRCGTCRMKLAVYRKTPTARPAYACPVHNGAGRCPDPVRVMAEEVDPLVEEMLLRAARRGPDHRAARRVERASGALTAAEAALEIAREDRGSVPSADGRARSGLMAAAAAEVERLALALADARAAAAVPAEPAQDHEAAWPTLTLAERRDKVGVFFDCAFVVAGAGPVRERLFVCRRGEEPAGTPGPGRPIERIEPFDESSARTLRPPRVRLWGERRIERELRDWRPDATVWPEPTEFLDAGRARLQLQVLEWGGPVYWSRRLGWQVRLPLRWSEERVRGALRPYLKGHDEFPRERDFRRLDAKVVYEAAVRHGGVRRWAEEFGIAMRERPAH
jgi:DNA invertase Pin-like site-specific DNA recombinase